MIDVAALCEACVFLFGSFTPWMVVVPGLVIGLVIGSIPGLQISMAMVICLPLTMHLDFLVSMLLLTSIFTGGTFGGGVTAILMNIPGTSSAMATTFDGFPMTRKGQHNEALGLALGASTLACGFGYIVLLLLIEPMSLAVLQLGPAEMLGVIFLAIICIGVLHTGNTIKGVLSGLIGLLLGSVGYSELGVARGTLGIESLLDGIAVVPAMIGLLAVAELFSLFGTRFVVLESAQRKVEVTRMLNGFKEVGKHPVIAGRGALVGILVGIIPGIGSSIANLVSYALTRKLDKRPELYGQGNHKGVIAAEAANSSAEAGSMATLLALGIPGGGATAVMLAVFSMHNITGGPTFIREQTEVVYAIVLANLGQVILLAGLGFLIVPLLAMMVKVSLRFLIPVVLSLAVCGAYALTGSMVGPYTLLFFSVVGYLMKRNDYSVYGLLIGLLLGNMAESEFVRTLQISGGDYRYLFTRPVALLLFVCALMVLLACFIRHLHCRLQHRKAE